MIQTLFETIESKSEIRERARRLVFLYSALREAPEEIETRKEQIAALQHFVDLHNRRKMADPNVWDGLQRLIGDPEELLTERDCAWMRRQKRFWKPYRYAHLCSAPGQLLPTCMHPKELQYLQNMQAFLRSELEAIETSVPDIQREIDALRHVGPLPEKIAEQYKLTIDGLPLKEKRQ